MVFPIFGSRFFLRCRRCGFTAGARPRTPTYRLSTASADIMLMKGGCRPYRSYIASIDGGVHLTPIYSFTRDSSVVGRGI